MSATIDDHTVCQGETYSRDYIVQDEDGAVIDITGYAVRSQWRRSIGSSATLAVPTCSVVSGPAGQCRVELTAVDSAAIAYRKVVFDVEIVSPLGVVTRIAQGVITIDREVTR